MVDYRIIQHFLKSAGSYSALVDGMFGPKSYAAARATLTQNGVVNSSWDNDRVYVAIQQLFFKKTNVNPTIIVDGLVGPVFRRSLELYREMEAGKNPTTPQRTVWPRQRDVPSFFGKVGTDQVFVESPYPLYMDYERRMKLNRFKCHEKVAPGVRRVLQRTLEHYGQKKLTELRLDIFSGCSIVRKIRGGSGYSMHSWGIAIDWDAAHNAMAWNHKRAAFAKPIYSKFLDFWEEEGWISLGRERDFDWMHVQAARL